MTKGRILLVPFPFDDLSATKVRPAVCLTSPAGRHRHLVLAFITSRAPTDLLDSDLVLDPGDIDFLATGLRTPSVVRLHRVLTVTSSLVRRQLGELSPRLLADLGEKLRRLFQL